MPSPRIAPTDLHQLIAESLALYNGIFSDVAIERRFAPDIPLVRLDAGQIRRVMINLVDNAIEATERRGRIVVETQRDAANNVTRIVVADDGPGIPPAERGEIVPAVLFDQAPGERSRPGDRAPDHRGARGQYRRRRQHAARDTLFDRAAELMQESQ